jgi:hypothetical protein
VLVVTGAGVKPHGHQSPAAKHVEVDADVDELLRHLGVGGE